MQGRRDVGRIFDSDPFGGFGSFDGFGSFGGIGGHQSLMSGLFGGRDPFDDPFFKQPFGGMLEPSFFGPRGSPFAGAPHDGFIDQQEPQPNKRRGPVIEELNSDDEKEGDGGAPKTKDNPRKHSRLNKEPYVEIPDDEADGGRNKHVQHRNQLGKRMKNSQPQSGSQVYTFQSSTVSYGGANGEYYTKSTTRRAGSDGIAFEEFKEADSTTGQANHRVSRALHNKGHYFSRKLNSDGRVDTSQMLHNLNEDELDRFEQAWDGSSGRHLSGSMQRLKEGNAASGSSGQISRVGWALPSTQASENLANTNNYVHMENGNSAAHIQHTGRRATDHGSGGRTRA